MEKKSALMCNQLYCIVSVVDFVSVTRITRHLTLFSNTGYIIQITTRKYSPRIKDGTKIQLFGMDGKTNIHKLTPSENAPPSGR